MTSSQEKGEGVRDESRFFTQQVGQDGLMRSRARRWARCVDEATWPEVLRRYLLASRATLPQPSAADLSADSALADDDVAAVCAAEFLADRPFYRRDLPKCAKEF